MNEHGARNGPCLRAHHHVALTVADLDRSAAWYAEVLGFVERFREAGDERRACIMGFADGPFSVALVEHLGGADDRFDPTRCGLDHLAFSVSSSDELHAWARQLTDREVDHSGVLDIPPGAILNFKDPDGISLALFWDR